MKRIKFPLIILAAAMGAASLPVHATNGYFLPGFGIRSMGMGGVGIASGADSISAAANPANLSKLEHRMDVGVTLFNPERTSRVYGASPFGFSGGGASDEDLFPMPEFGFAMPFTSDLAFGFAMVGNGGMNTTYRNNFFNYRFATPNVPGQNYPVGVDLMQVLIPVSAAYKVQEKHTLGASVVFAVQRFAAVGLQAFPLFDAGMTITSDPNHLTNKGFDWSFGGGVKFGWLGDFLDDKLSIGATWASKTYMTRFERYQGLFAEHGDFDIPENYGVGIAIKPNKNWLMAIDVTRIRYGGIASIANRGPGAPIGPAGIPSIANPLYELGNDLGMGFGWKDQTVYKWGVEYTASDKLQLRMGYNYGKSPISDDQVTFNTLAPGVVEQHYSVGFTYKPEKDVEVTANYMYAALRQQSACGQNIVDCASIAMHQNSLGVNVSWLF